MADTSPRVVSLLPAATEIVCALGLRGGLVGRSHECDFPEDVAALPVLTSARVDSALRSDALDAQVRAILEQKLPLYALDEARLSALAPEVVITQASCEVCAIDFKLVEGTLARTSSRARLISLQPARLGDVLDDIAAVAAACGVTERGAEVVRGLRRRLDAIPPPSGPRPRVAVVEWLAPPMLAGHWIPDCITAAGGEPVGPAPGVPSPYATWDEIRALRPDAVVVGLCGFDLERTLREARTCEGELRSLSDRVLFMDGNAYLNRPGPRLVDAAEIIGAWLRGEPVPLEAARA
jgi:iron complex transport system substrate-binding protein